MGTSGQTLLGKYDDVEELAIKKKRADRIQLNSDGPNNNQSKSKAKNAPTAESDETNITSHFTNRVISSDYYASVEEDPLMAGGSFKKKAVKAGSKRSRIQNTLSLQDNQEEDIVSVLENTVSDAS